MNQSNYFCRHPHMHNKFDRKWSMIIVLDEFSFFGFWLKIIIFEFKSKPKRVCVFIIPFSFSISFKMIYSHLIIFNEICSIWFSHREKKELNYLPFGRRNIPYSMILFTSKIHYFNIFIFFLHSQWLICKFCLL